MVSKLPIALSLLMIIPIAAFAQQVNHLNLEIYKWKNRLLLVFAPSVDNDRYFQQSEILEGKKSGLKDRDLKIFHLTAGGNASVDEKPIPEAGLKRLAGKYDVDPEIFIRQACRV